jgi:hypothetical protein
MTPCPTYFDRPSLPPVTAVEMSRVHDGRTAHYFGVSFITVP